MKKPTENEVKNFTANNPEFSNITPDDVNSKSDEILNKMNVVKEFAKLAGNVKTMVNMVKAYCSKKYTKIPKRTIGSICFALFYIFFPFDLIPDNIPVAGYLDDVVVVESVLKSVNKDVEDYKEWEQQTSAA